MKHEKHAAYHVLLAQLTAAWMLSDPPEPWAVFLTGIGGHPPYGAPPEYFTMYSPADVAKAAPLRALQPGSRKPPHLGPGGITGYRNLSQFNDTFFYEQVGFD